MVLLACSAAAKDAELPVLRHEVAVCGGRIRNRSWIGPTVRCSPRWPGCGFRN
jgi:hypothetical protein